MSVHADEKETGERTTIKRCGELYDLETWVKPRSPNKCQAKEFVVFGRHGSRWLSFFARGKSVGGAIARGGR